MNRIINLAITILVLFVVNVLSQEPDELYVQIYDIIQIAENFSKSGDSKMALKKYLEAKSALEQFQKNYPQWNPNVIKYRLDFVSDKIAGLEKIQPKPTPTQTVTQQPQQQPVKTTQPQPAREIPQDIKDQIDFLQQQISQLKIERDQLQVKLKEALSVQPAAVDPGELARANEKIRNLEKQVELLQLSINQEREKSSNNITNTDINSKLKAMESQIATLIKDNATKEAKIQSLIAEKEALELSLKNKQPKADGENIQAVKNLEKELALANEKVIDLSKKLESITKEKAVLEKQVAALMSEQKSKGSRDKDIKRIKELEKENEELQKKLNALSKDYYNVQQKNQTAKLTDLENQIVALKARLDAYEMKAIPHTPEEIALMTKTELVRVRPE
ncbi:MAG TPA: hypothetical protein PLW02_12795, partial [Verrucomicrobiota bacterium]|nr:hypothetical protein [Verrucomicrobiota bacterium]